MIDNSTNPILAFSGGKDSLACLHLLKDQLHKICVVWVNTGKNYPEVLATIIEAKKLCPIWVELKSDRTAQWAKFGMPSDILPIWNSIDGQSIKDSKQDILIQGAFSCCFSNTTAPLLVFARSIGSNLLIMGRRNDDTIKNTAEHLQTVQGITVFYPIQNWHKEDVLKYLEGIFVEMPEHLYLNQSSMDCYDCTAFLEFAEDRAAFTRKNYPAVHADWLHNMAMIRKAIELPLKTMDRLMEQ